MSFILRPTSRALLCSTQIIKRQAHKKANIEVKLNQFVEGVGLQDEIISVRPGLMRNVLYPTGKASYIQKTSILDNVSTENNDELNAKILQQVALESQKKKKKLLGDLEDVRQLVFNRAVVPNSDSTFGSVTAEDLISKLKEEFGLEVEKSTIDFKSEGGRIKSLGKHQVSVQIGQETAEINVVVKAAA